MSDAQSSRTPKALPPSPLGPTAAELARLPLRQQARLEEELGAAAALYDSALFESLPPEQQLAMAESESHNDTVSNAKSALRAFYRRAGGSLYIASNLAVYYPGEHFFAPDLLAVRDVPRRKRSAYVVAREGKGLDLVVEVLFQGDRTKDLGRNVEHFARLGIPEYFVADLNKRRIHHFLLAEGGHRYTPQLGALGRYRSQVLGLDLALVDDELRFYSGTAVVPLIDEEVDHLYGQVQREQEQAAAAQEQAAAAQEQAAAAQEQAAGLRAQLCEALMTILRLRGLTIPAEREAQVRACQDDGLLQRWLQRAATASLDELFLDG